MTDPDPNDPATLGHQIQQLVCQGPHDLVALQYGLGYRFRRIAMLSEIRDACERLVAAGTIIRRESATGVVWTVH